MPHTISIPDEMWNWAVRECETKNEGPAFYLRDLLIGAMLAKQQANGFVHKPQPQPQSQSQTSSQQPPEQAYGAKGKGVHQECYKDMAREWMEKFPGHEIPFASPMPEAKLLTVCPRCLDQIRPGEPIMITTMANWG